MSEIIAWAVPFFVLLLVVEVLAYRFGPQLELRPGFGPQLGMRPGTANRAMWRSLKSCRAACWLWARQRRVIPSIECSVVQAHASA